MEKKREKLWQGISINVILLGIVSLLTDISSEMIHPLLPMFIIALGGAGLGFLAALLFILIGRKLIRT